MGTEVLPDERTLRSGRRQRALDQMAAHDLDVLVLGGGIAGLVAARDLGKRGLRVAVLEGA